MSTKKFTDWHGWFDGMRSKAMKAGAESITTSIGALLTTNGLAGMKVPGCADLGMGWKTAIATMLIQFSLRVIFAAAQYVAGKPDPDVIPETVDTDFMEKKADGTSVAQSSSTITTTPISPVLSDPAKMEKTNEPAAKTAVPPVPPA